MGTALDVAHLFLSWSKLDGDLISNLKIQKLLYYAQAWYLANYKKPLFQDDFEAWELGPVIPSVYRHYKIFKSNPIKYKNGNMDITEEKAKFTKKEIKYLEDFYNQFIEYSAHLLINSAHNEKPWKIAYPNQIITKNSMQSFYSDLLKKDEV